MVNLQRINCQTQTDSRQDTAGSSRTRVGQRRLKRDALMAAGEDRYRGVTMDDRVQGGRRGRRNRRRQDIYKMELTSEYWTARGHDFFFSGPLPRIVKLRAAVRTGRIVETPTGQEQPGSSQSGGKRGWALEVGNPGTGGWIEPEGVSNSMGAQY